MELEYNDEVISDNYFDPTKNVQWMEKYWALSILIGTSYAIFLFKLMEWMKSREPFVKLFWISFTFYGFLMIVNIFGTINTLSHLINVIRKEGFYHSVCSNRYTMSNPSANYWMWIFNFVKIIELFDIVFYVLLKKPPLYLTIYHHPVALIEAWYGYKLQVSMGLWMVAVNYYVHVFIYIYYFARIFYRRMPKIVPIVVLSQELMQLILHIYLIWYAFLQMGTEESCDIQFFDNAVCAFVSFTIILSFTEILLRPSKVDLDVDSKNK